MHPVFLASVLAGCVALAGLGAVMVGRQPVIERFPDAQPVRRRGAAVRRSPVSAAIDRLGALFAPAALGLVSAGRRSRIDAELDAAGRPHGMTVEAFAGRKAAYALLMAGAGVAFAISGLPSFALALPVLGWFLPDLDLKGKAADRQEEITRTLPDFLDVLAVTVSAGLDFRAALDRVAGSFDGPLSDEVRIALQQMRLGAPRRQALAQLRRRNQGAEPLGEFVGALQQAEELGAPLTDALNDIAADVRRAYGQEARREAAKVEPRLSVLTTLTLIPASMIVIGVGFWLVNEIDLGGIFGG